MASLLQNAHVIFGISALGVSAIREPNLQRVLSVARHRKDCFSILTFLARDVGRYLLPPRFELGRRERYGRRWSDAGQRRELHGL